MSLIRWDCCLTPEQIEDAKYDPLVALEGDARRELHRDRVICTKVRYDPRWQSILFRWEAAN